MSAALQMMYKQAKKQTHTCTHTHTRTRLWFVLIPDTRPLMGSCVQNGFRTCVESICLCLKTLQCVMWCMSQHTHTLTHSHTSTQIWPRDTHAQATCTHCLLASLSPMSLSLGTEESVPVFIIDTTWSKCVSVPPLCQQESLSNNEHHFHPYNCSLLSSAVVSSCACWQSCPLFTHLQCPLVWEPGTSTHTMHLYAQKNILLTGFVVSVHVCSLLSLFTAAAWMTIHYLGHKNTPFIGNILW